jgi:hypothetical protein
MLLLLLVPAQGRFTRPVSAGNLCMGQEFVKPGNAPPWLGELVFTAAAKVFSSSTQVRNMPCHMMGGGSGGPQDGGSGGHYVVKQ